MNKFYRSLVAGLAVIGLVGCGDDVTVAPPQPLPPPPVPVITVTVAPNGVTIPVGGTVQMAAAVSGASGAAITWSTSSPTVATVNATGLVTGVAAGSAGITATATANGVTGAGSATITVSSTQTTPATISIGAITNVAGTPVVLAAVAGQINVALNLERGGETIQRVELLLDNQVVGTQNFTLLASKAQEAGEEFDVIEVITISFNTASFDATTGVADFLNGARTLSAKVITAENQQGTASPSIGITLANVSIVNLSVSASGASATNPGTGILWSTGNLVVTATPVVFTASAPTVTQVTITPTVNGTGALNVKTVQGPGPFVFTWAKGTSQGSGGSAGVEGTVSFAATSVVGGVAGPAGPTPLPAFNLDNLGPAAPTVGAMPIFVNGTFVFVAGPTAATGVTVGADGGVGGVTAAFFVGAVTALPGSPNSCSVTGLTEITVANETDLPATITSTVFRGRVVTQDLLANMTCRPLAPGGVSAGTFGSDFIAPTGTMTGPANGSAAAATGASFVFTVADNASGFGATPLSGIIKRLNANNSTSCVFGSGSGCTVPGTSVLTLDAYNSSPTDGYYTFDPITISDVAGNTLSFTGRTYLLDQVPAAFSGGLSLQALYVGGATATFTTQATDNLDLNNVFGTLAYPNAPNPPTVIQFPPQQIGTFGAPLEKSAAVNFAVANFMRCLNVANDFTTTTNQANSVNLFLSDFAQATPTAFGATPIPPANVQACGAVGNIATTDIFSFNQNAPVFPAGKTQVDISGTGLAGASSETVTLSVVADVALNTSVAPFSRVDFYYQNTTGNWVQVGQGTATLSQTGGPPSQRLWTYTFVWNPDAAVQVATVTVTAIGVDSNGDAVFAGTARTVTTVQ